MAIVNGLWIGERLSALERACVQSFLNHGHRFHLYAYGPVDNVPAHCQMLDANTILSADKVFVHAEGVARGSLATFSNLFRYRLLYEIGGWWTDLDVLCLTPSLPEGDIVIGRQDANLINDAVMHFPPKHRLMKEMFAEASARGQQVKWGEIGPELVTRYFTTNALAHIALPESIFYPIHFSQYWNVYDPRRVANATQQINGSACLHLWNEMIRRAGIDKNVLPPQGSLLRNLLEATLGAADFTHEYTLSANCPPDSLALTLIARQ